MLKFLNYKATSKGIRLFEKIAHVSEKARYINSPIGLDHQQAHSKDHHAPMHPKEAFRKTTYDLRKDNNINVKKKYTFFL